MSASVTSASRADGARNPAPRLAVVTVTLPGDGGSTIAVTARAPISYSASRSTARSAVP